MQNHRLILIGVIAFSCAIQGIACNGCSDASTDSAVAAEGAAPLAKSDFKDVEFQLKSTENEDLKGPVRTRQSSQVSGSYKHETAGPAGIVVLKVVWVRPNGTPVTMDAESCKITVRGGRRYFEGTLKAPRKAGKYEVRLVGAERAEKKLVIYSRPLTVK